MGRGLDLVNRNIMSKPIVAIVGRPNVGKSTLFNVLAGSELSIVKDTPGVTRDRIYADVDWSGYSFTLIDTGGIEPDSDDQILKEMKAQAQIAIDTADVIIFLVDVKQGLVDADGKVADMLLRHHIELDSPCHGNGSCHKCRVTADGVPALACALKAKDGMSIQIPKMQGVRFPKR